ncbi:hypothetical protein IWZ00DRAFT_492412 [Phyllosticta capitalensis]
MTFAPLSPSAPFLTFLVLGAFAHPVCSTHPSSLPPGPHETKPKTSKDLQIVLQGNKNRKSTPPTHRARIKKPSLIWCLNAKQIKAQANPPNRPSQQPAQAIRFSCPAPWTTGAG